ncbi:MAG: DNA polymerase III subunit gamma/tau [Candidatus Blackburnbacteria bacterium]|nr:DNA polymerase III subunit gamma/tau [Candidatus Blackburnbacteria bacterium]
MTLYLKYRPQTIEQLDIAEVRRELKNIIGSGKIPHAFLFAGPRGSGKTSAARILAKAVNCEKPKKDGEPCNKCDQCISITKGRSLDIIEIDAASHRGVEDIRTLREAVKLSPAGAKKKVYIIDEAHMLTTEASNALLKTLEEPPEHAIFILATTAPEKLLDTIRSRCTILTFHKATVEEGVKALTRAVKGEDLKVEKGVLEEIARSVDGSFREAHKVLEQLSFGKKKIGVEDVRKLVALGEVQPAALLALLTKKDTRGALEEIDNVVAKGVNLRVYTSEIVGILRRGLLGRFGVETDLPAGKAGIETELGLDVEEIKSLIKLFLRASLELPIAVIPQLPLELVAIQWCEGGEEDSQSIRSPLNSSPAVGGTRSRGLRPASVGDSAPLDPLSNKRGHRSSTASSSSVEKAEELVAREQTSAPKIEGTLEDMWREVMRRTKEKNHSIEALLRATRPLGIEGNVLRIEVFYQFHKERIESDPYRKVIENVAVEVLGKPVRISCFLSPSPKRAADLVNIASEVEEDIVKAAEEIFGQVPKDLEN